MNTSSTLCRVSDICVEQCIIIKLLNFEKCKTKEIYERLRNFYCEETISLQNIQKWCREFTASRSNVQDIFRLGRPKTVLTPALKEEN